MPWLLYPSDGEELYTLVPDYRWDNGNDPDATFVMWELYSDRDLTQLVSWASMLYYPGEYGLISLSNLDPATWYYWRVYLRCGDVAGPSSLPGAHGAPEGRWQGGVPLLHGPRSPWEDEAIHL